MNLLKKVLVFIVYIFIVIPLLFTILVSFTNSEAFKIDGFTLKWFIEAFKSDMFMSALFNSLMVSIVATVFAMLIALATGYAIYKNVNLKKLSFLFDAPLIVPHIVLSFLLFQILIVKVGLSSFSTLVVAHTLILLPYAIKAIISALLKFDPKIELAARSLGMSSFSTVFKVIIPNMSNTILAVGLLSFINSFNNLSISIFLTGPGLNTLPLQMMSYIEYFYDPLVAAVSVMIITITFLVVIFVEKKLKFSLIK